MKINTAAKKYLIGLAFTCGLLMSSGLANAATVNCPGTVADNTDREFSLTTDVASTCLAYGPDNINGNNDVINALGYLTLDKSDDTTSGLLAPSTLTVITGSLVEGLSGSFSISAPGFIDLVLAFKTGTGDLDPDWAAFLLAPGTTIVSWFISGQQELSHIVLYGKVDPNSNNPVVPLPAGILLLISALGGLGFLSRFRKAGTAA